MSTPIPLPPALQEIADDFADLAAPQRLELLLEFSEGLPDLPERYAGSLESMEQVHECQSPLFLVVEVADDVTDEVADDAADGGRPSAAGSRQVHVYFSAPPEAPTTRGFAGILKEGLDGLTVDEVLAVPDDAPYRFSLAEAVSPLRLRGMVGMLSRIKRQTALKAHI
ncbi:SufE family protein [Nostocoides sp. HKS02]|uniref:SufE family protein n=1 Tax=Nostocoides sp. HKS02 TaxID=1813880 RepID=UPI0012B49B43|nr:SufE family protein [Tetrasphaera sp. HKS02]QGN57647.1 cysteine desulfuration protein SufE [Tetrasphaera sp. HKS02]